MRKNRFIKFIFPIICLLVLLPWPVAYAYDVNQEDQETIRIEVAETSVEPSFTVWGKAIGGIDSGELFYIDATNNAADIVATVYLTNANELVSHYTFLMLKVGVYVEKDGSWEKACASNGELIPQTILSMRNGQVSFLLPGYAKYKVTIDGGSFYATNAHDDGNLSPQLYLEAN